MREGRDAFAREHAGDLMAPALELRVKR
jgi:hypothetical protein